MIFGRHTTQPLTSCGIAWPTIAMHLKVDELSPERPLIEIYQETAIGYCEALMRRGLRSHDVTIVYDIELGQLTAGDTAFALYFPIDERSDIKIYHLTDEAETLVTDYKLVRGTVDYIQLPTAMLTGENITITYTSEPYQRAHECIPAVLMKLTQIYCNRDGNMTMSKVDGVASLLSKHRIKFHF